MTKILLASGCSYTSPNFTSQDISIDDDLRGGWPMWPELVADDLNLNCVNLGKNGLDNFSIYNDIIKFIAENGNNIEIIMVLWSSWDRILLYNYFRYPMLSIFSKLLMGSYKHAPGPNKEEIIKLLNNKEWDFYNFTKKSIDRNISLMYSLASICKLNSIKLIQFQGLYPINFYNIEFLQKYMENPGVKITNQTISDILIKTPIFYSLEKYSKNIIGWPFLQNLNGYTFDDLRKNEYRISKNDAHPNSLGQIEISKYFLKRYYKLYD